MCLECRLKISNSSSIAHDEYTVERGDTLWNIASKYLGSGIRYQEIKALNGLTGDIIFPGQVLKLPRR